MKLAVDPCLLKNVSVTEMFTSVAQAGYEAVELTARRIPGAPPRQPPGARNRSDLRRASPRHVSRSRHCLSSSPGPARIAGSARPQCRASGQRSTRRRSSAVPGSTRSSPEHRIGRVNAGAHFCDPLMRSSAAERQGVSLTIEPHPYDFIETNTEAVDLIREIDSRPSLPLLHAAHISSGRRIAAMIEYAAPVWRTSSGGYVPPGQGDTQPPGSWGPDPSASGHRAGRGRLGTVFSALARRIQRPGHRGRVRLAGPRDGLCGAQPSRAPDVPGILTAHASPAYPACPAATVMTAFPASRPPRRSARASLISARSQVWQSGGRIVPSAASCSTRARSARVPDGCRGSSARAGPRSPGPARNAA